MSKTVYNENFYGIYEKTFSEFVIYKRSLGFNYGKSYIYNLKRLNKFLIDQYHPSEVVLTQLMVLGFLGEFNNFSSRTFHNTECLLRQLGLYLERMGYTNIYIYPENKKKVTSFFVPYVYSKDEICRLFNATDSLPEKSKYDDTYRIFYQTLFRLLYSTGMRISEALNLKEEDINLEVGTITINNGKNNVSRILPVCDSMLYWLRKYHHYTFDDNRHEYFFKPIRCNRIKRSHSTITHFFKSHLIPLVSINRKKDKTGPRIHDLRHTFACHSLDKIIKEGKDAYCVLPSLSVYMGHMNIESTEKYLRLTEEHFKEMTDAIHYIYEESIGDKGEK